MIQINELYNILPVLILAAGILLILILEIILKKNKLLIYVLSVCTALSALVSALFMSTKDVFIFNEMVKTNGYSIAFSIIILFSVLLTFVSSKPYLEKSGINYGEFYIVVLSSALGMLIMLFANDFLLIFLGLELMSICFYILVGFFRRRIKSNESALKYLLLGAFISGFLLYGISLMYGTTGSTKITFYVTITGLTKSPIFLIGFILFVIGFLFKMGAFPFHMWIPDVYEGAPTVVTGLLSTAGKVAAVGTIAPIIIGFNIIDFKTLISIIAVLTMLFGNVIALAQTSIKRLLAYSSIASAGYILVGIASIDEFAVKGIAFYLTAYVFMQLGAFIVISIYESGTADGRDYSLLNLEDYKGLAKRNPLLGIIFTIFLLSLAGIPPFAGFWGKYYLFYAAIKSNLIWLSVVAILLSLVSLYYYLKVIVYMWFNEPSENFADINIPFDIYGKITLFLCAIGTLVFGINPNLFFIIFNFAVK